MVKNMQKNKSEVFFKNSKTLEFVGGGGAKDSYLKTVWNKKYN